MRTNFLFIVLFAILSMYVPKQSLASQYCSDVPVHLQEESVTRAELIQELGRTLHRSLVVELLSTQEPRKVELRPNALTVADYARALCDHNEVKCEIDGPVVHLYSPAAVSARQNALNYTFEDFSVPRLADLFVISFRIRLLAEAFRNPDQGLTSGSDAGATGNDADRYQLSPERLTSVKARSLLLREAKVVPIIFAVEIKTDPALSDQAAWKLTNESMLFSVLR